MFVDDFKLRYTTIPFATHQRNRKRNTRTHDTRTLLHMHREIEVFLVLEGEAEVEMNAQSYKMEAGDLAVMAPYTLHRYTIFADRDIHHDCLCFDADLLFDKELKEELESGVLPLAALVRNEPQVAECVKNAYLAHALQKEGWEFQVVGNLNLLFGILKEKGYLQKHREQEKKSLYSSIYQFISTHYGEEITSLDGAEELNLNHSYFCRIFKRNFGESFQNYLCKFRIEKSMELLRHTEKSVSQIALETGFHSFSYFGKKFKEYTGRSPREWRKG